MKFQRFGLTSGSTPEINGIGKVYNVGISLPLETHATQFATNDFVGIIKLLVITYTWKKRYNVKLNEAPTTDFGRIIHRRFRYSVEHLNSKIDERGFA